ncbi:PAS domain-containing protein [Chromatium okenii]
MTYLRSKRAQLHGKSMLKVNSLISPLVESILGYRPDELIGKQHFYDLSQKRNARHLKHKHLKYLRVRLFQDLVNVAQHRNGQRVWLLTHGQPFFDANGTLLGYRGADQDVTAWQEALSRLAASEQRFRIVFDHAPLGIAIPDAKRRFIYINHAYAKLLGRDVRRCWDSVLTA